MYGHNVMVRISNIHTAWCTWLVTVVCVNMSIIRRVIATLSQSFTFPEILLLLAFWCMLCCSPLQWEDDWL